MKRWSGTCCFRSKDSVLCYLHMHTEDNAQQLPEGLIDKSQSVCQSNTLTDLKTECKEEINWILIRLKWNVEIKKLIVQYRFRSLSSNRSSTKFYHNSKGGESPKRQWKDDLAWISVIESNFTDSIINLRTVCHTYLHSFEQLVFFKKKKANMHFVVFLLHSNLKHHPNLDDPRNFRIQPDLDHWHYQSFDSGPPFFFLKKKKLKALKWFGNHLRLCQLNYWAFLSCVIKVGITILTCCAENLNGVGNGPMVVIICSLLFNYYERQERSITATI